MDSCESPIEEIFIDYIPERDEHEEDLNACRICTRKFRSEVYEKHVSICEKMAAKKRKRFDSSRQRREGTDMALYLPKNFGLPEQKVSATNVQPKIVSTNKTSPKPNLMAKQDVETPKTVQPFKRDQPLRKSVRNTPPVSEQCPHCERCFGVKAFDRHVEWCEKKTKLIVHQTPPPPNAAKEKLEARTKYRPPALKNKRDLNREKYSGEMSCGTSMNSILSDSFSIGKRSKSNSMERERKSSVASMTSSIASDCGLSPDKYDPFVSAKRQLDELFSPTHPNASTPISYKSNTMSTSLTTKSPSNTSSSLTPIKSTFRRTSSLRMPKKAPKPLLYIPTYKPTTTIQRGISDEGPISSNFLKPEEYDELPVKGHANVVTQPDIIPRPVSRSSSRSRESSPVFVVKRDQNSGLNRRNLKLEINKPNAPSSDYPLSKTDSLAVFLKYEDDLSCSPGLTEKERKDKSNSLNKQTGLKNSFAELLESKIDRGSESPPEQIFSSKKYSSVKLEPLDPSIIERTANINASLVKPQSIPPPTPSQMNEIQNTFFDPDLINDCDNLSVSRVNDLQTSKSNSGLSEAPLVNVKSSDSVDSNKIGSQRNSGEKRTLKRSLKLNKENFLYDTSPVSKDPPSPYSNKDFGHKQIETISSPPLQTSESFNKLRYNETIDTLFDDFDFDEFISSFEDDEQYPIFKGYKELMMSNRSMNKLNKSDSSSSSSTTSFDKGEPNSEEMSSPNVCDNSDGLVPSHKPSYHPQCAYPTSMMSRNGGGGMVDSETQMTHRESCESTINKVEKEIIQNVKDLTKLCKVGASPVVSVESDDQFLDEQNDKIRKDSDSAYSSLSRHSQFDINGRRDQRQRPQIFQIPDIVTSKRQPQQHQPYQTNTTDASTRMRQVSHSLSSSGSESSLPPIISQKSHDMPHSGGNVNGHQKDTATLRLSKFCPGCGCRFTLMNAKFCMECGMKRVALE